MTTIQNVYIDSQQMAGINITANITVELNTKSALTLDTVQ
jgi:hypothetical protein